MSVTKTPTIEFPAAAAEGTCVQLTETAPLWAVRGRGGWHRCDAERGTCDCADYLFRRASRRDACRHLRALAAYLLLAETVRQRFEAPEQGAHDERAPLPTDAELRRMFA